MPNRPNLLYILPDQLGARWMGTYGHPHAATPVLDRLAGQGHLFTQAYTAVPLCTPYRACLFTGLYPTQTGVRANGQSLPQGLPRLAERLNEAGYATHYVGKWHLSGEPQHERWVPPSQRGGFTHFVGWESHHVDHFAGRIWRDDPDAAIVMPGHESDALTDIACEQLSAAAASSEPFAMFVAYQAPHPPCTPPEEYYDLYAEVGLTDTPPASVDAVFTGWGCRYGPAEFRRRYLAEITHLDACVGRLLARLEQLGLADDTVVMFTSDHGELAGAHGRFGKEVMYQEAVQVPLIVRMPGGGGGVRHDGPVGTVDLTATVLDLCGAGPLGIGRSVAPRLRGEPMEGSDRAVFIETERQLCAVQDGWKLIAARCDLAPVHLFDLSADPWEQRDRLGDPAVADCVHAMTQGLTAWWQSLTLGPKS